MIKVNDVVRRKTRHATERATVLATFEKQSDSVSIDLVLKLEDGRTPYPYIFFGRSEEWEPVGFEVGKYYTLKGNEKKRDRLVTRELIERGRIDVATFTVDRLAEKVLVDVAKAGQLAVTLPQVKYYAHAWRYYDASRVEEVLLTPHREIEDINDPSTWPPYTDIIIVAVSVLTRAPWEYRK